MTDRFQTFIVFNIHTRYIQGRFERLRGTKKNSKTKAFYFVIYFIFYNLINYLLSNDIIHTAFGAKPRTNVLVDLPSELFKFQDRGQLPLLLCPYVGANRTAKYQ